MALPVNINFLWYSKLFPSFCLFLHASWSLASLVQLLLFRNHTRICHPPLEHFPFQIPSFLSHILSVKLPTANKIFAPGQEPSLLSTKTLLHPTLQTPNLYFSFSVHFESFNPLSTPLCLNTFIPHPSFVPWPSGKDKERLTACAGIWLVILSHLLYTLV